MPDAEISDSPQTLPPAPSMWGIESMLRLVGLPWIFIALLGQWSVAESHRVSLTWHYAAVLALSVALISVGRGFFVIGSDNVRLWKMVLLAVVLLLAIGWMSLWQLPSGLMLSGIVIGIWCLIYLALYVSPPGSRMQIIVLVLVCGGASMAISASTLPTSLKWAGYLFLFGLSVLFSSPAAIYAVRFHFPKEVCAALVFALGCGAAVHFWVDDGHSWLCAEVLVLWGLLVVCFSTIRLQKSQDDEDPRERMACSMRRRTVAMVLLVTLVMRLAGWWGALSSEKMLHHAVVAASALGLLMVHRFSSNSSERSQRMAVDMAMILPLLTLCIWSAW